jgi:hypothetical protein
MMHRNDANAYGRYRTALVTLTNGKKAHRRFLQQLIEEVVDRRLLGLLLPGLSLNRRLLPHCYFRYQLFRLLLLLFLTLVDDLWWTAAIIHHILQALRRLRTLAYLHGE